MRSAIRCRRMRRLLRRGGCKRENLHIVYYGMDEVVVHMGGSASCVGHLLHLQAHRGKRCTYRLVLLYSPCARGGGAGCPSAEKLLCICYDAIMFTKEMSFLFLACTFGMCPRGKWTLPALAKGRVMIWSGACLYSTGGEPEPRPSRCGEALFHPSSVVDFIVPPAVQVAYLLYM